VPTRPLTLCLAALTAVVVSAAPVAAQSRAPERNDSQFGLKYSVANEEDFDWAATGFIVDGAFKVCATGAWRCQAVGELAYHKFKDFGGGDPHTHTQFAGGIRFASAAASRARPFVQFLVGVQRCCDENAAVYQIGGGVNVELNEGLDLQIQADLPWAKYSGTFYRQFRLGFGVAIPLGRR
jgi:hypothetical protein